MPSTDPANHPFREITAGLWVKERPLRFYGLEIGCRMTVIRLKNDQLFLHSPTNLEPRTLGGLQSLGPVSCIVAPNRFHHLFIGDYFKVFPQAKIYAAPGLQKKRSDLKFHGVLEDQAPPEYSGEIDQMVFSELPILREVVFFHRDTRTLILSDLCFNLGKEAPLLTRVLFRIIRNYKRFGPTADLRFLLRKKVPRAQMEKILDWDFDRIIMAHGKIVETGGKETFQGALNGLYGSEGKETSSN